MTRLIYAPAQTNVHIKDSLLACRLTQPRIKACWGNSVLAMVALHWEQHGLLPEGTLYVEGFMISIFGIPMEHGWLSRPDGSIIDVTMALPGTDKPRKQHRLAGVRYYPGPSYTYDQVISHWEQDNDAAWMPFVHWETIGGKKTWGTHSMEYQRAYVSSLRDSLDGDVDSLERMFPHVLHAILRDHPGLEDRTLEGLSPLETLDQTEEVAS